MLSDTVIGLAIALIVISSVAWVSQYRKIRDRMKLRKAVRAEHDVRATH
jgi:hypothetical protein